MHIEGYVVMVPTACGGFLLHGQPLEPGQATACLTTEWKTFPTAEAAQEAAHIRQHNSSERLKVRHISLDLVRVGVEYLRELDELADKEGPFVCIYVDTFSPAGETWMQFYGDRCGYSSPYPAANFTLNGATPFKEYDEAFRASWQIPRQGDGGCCWLSVWNSQEVNEVNHV